MRRKSTGPQENQTDHATVDIQAVPSILRAALPLFFLGGLLFFSGFATVGSLVIGGIESRFYASAEAATGTVTRIERKAEREQITKSNGSTQERVTYSDVLTIAFEAASGDNLTAKRSNGARTLFSVGDEVAIWYDPDHPTNIRLDLEKANNAMPIIFRISATIFAVTLLAAYAFHRRRARR